VTSVLAFVAMEAVSYLAHRFVMHGFGMGWHRSHHAGGAAVMQRTGFEANDLFPVTFAAVTILTMTAGVTLPSFHPLFEVGIGVTAYGAAYAFVHDVYVHGRLGRLPRLPGLEWLKDAHELHHRFGGEPYGMLFPVVPRGLRERAATATLRHVGTEARVEKTS
jgi:beta-carotene 3-hydroxylase